MITSGLVVDGGVVGHGLPTHLPYNGHHHHPVHNRMSSYMEQQSYMKAVSAPSPQSSAAAAEPVTAAPEFLRPLPKPAPVNPLKAPRASKYPQPPPTDNNNACRPVNLTQAKEPPPPEHLRLDDRHHPYTMYGHPRLYVSASPYHPPYPMPAPYGVYTSPYAPVLPRDARHHLMQPPQERRYPSPPTKSGGTARTSPPSSSPPEQFKVPNGRVDVKQQPTAAQQRILQPPPVPTPAAVEPPVKKPRATPEPPSPPAKTSNFTKGSLIRLANGNIKKVEDMRTEDFLSSVENSDQHRIDPSTVVRIEPVTTDAKENVIRITLSYGDQRNQVGADAKRTSAACKSHQVEMQSGAEHPYFVFGRGWASWSPAKTLAKYGLTCQRLQVGDVCVSLTKRTAAVAVTEPTVVNAAAAVVHGSKRRSQLQVTAVQQQQHPPQNHHHHHHHQPQPPPPPQADDDKAGAGRNKRRWSAPDPEPAT